nr:hypothetical protein [Tanacetum cinerariifolium]
VLGMTGDGPLVFNEQRMLDKIAVGSLVLQMIADVMEVLGMTGDGPLVFNEQRVLDKIAVGSLVLQMIADVMEVNRIIVDDTESDWSVQISSNTSESTLLSLK